MRVLIWQLIHQVCEELRNVLFIGFFVSEFQSSTTWCIILVLQFVQRATRH